GVPAAAAHLLHIGIELIHQGCNRQACPVAPSLVQHQAQILTHPVHRKSKIELSFDHGFAAVIELPALSSSLSDYLYDLLHVQTPRLTNGDGLGQALTNAGNTDLIDHLAQLAGSGPAEQGDCLGKCKHDWP